MRVGVLVCASVWGCVCHRLKGNVKRNGQRQPIEK